MSDHQIRTHLMGQARRVCNLLEAFLEKASRRDLKKWEDHVEELEEVFLSLHTLASEWDKDPTFSFEEFGNYTDSVHAWVAISDLEAELRGG
jgi:hypothetical protein